MARISRRTTALSAAAAFVAAALVLSFCPCPVSAKTTLNAASLYTNAATTQTCLNAIWRIAGQRLQGASIPNCLRMSFHDAGTYVKSTDQGGANGSILRELGLSQNAGLGPCSNVITQIISQVRATAGCSKASAADVIQVTGAVAVYLAGGRACPMLMGRPDLASGQDSAASLPSQCNTISQLVTMFTNAGFSNPQASLVVLSGAHNIGQSRATPASTCSRGLGGLTRNNNAFDGHYYNELVAPPPKNARPAPGWFTSDNELFSGGNSVTRNLVQTYANNHNQFLSDWCAHYQEMSLLGVNPATNFGLMSPASLPQRRTGL